MDFLFVLAHCEKMLDHRVCYAVPEVGGDTTILGKVTAWRIEKTGGWKVTGYLQIEGMGWYEMTTLEDLGPR